MLNSSHFSKIIQNKLILAAIGDGAGKSGCRASSLFMKEKIDIADPKIVHSRQELYVACRSIPDPIVLGGDHSVAMSSVGASLDKFQGCKVLWIDAHSDINTPESSDSGNLHGMPLGYLTGQAPLPSWMPDVRLDPSNLCYVGLRDVDRYEQELIDSLPIQSYDMAYIHKHGWNDVLSKVRKFCQGQVHISLDVDAIDPVMMPSTGTPVEDGMTMSMAKDLLDIPACAIDIVETNLVLGSVKEQELTLKNTFELVEHVLENRVNF